MRCSRISGRTVAGSFARVRFIRGGETRPTGSARRCHVTPRSTKTSPRRSAGIWVLPPHDRQISGDYISFRGERMSAHDEAGEVAQYIWNHLRDCIAETDQRIHAAGLAREQCTRLDAVAGDDLRIRTLMKHGLSDDMDVNDALRDGFESFRRRIADQLLQDPDVPLRIHRCPKCARVLRTPLARQCWRCGHDWHVHSS